MKAFSECKRGVAHLHDNLISIAREARFVTKPAIGDQETHGTNSMRLALLPLSLAPRYLPKCYPSCTRAPEV